MRTSLDSNSGRSAGLSEAFQLFTPTPFARLLVVSLATHLLSETRPLAELSKSSHGFLNRLSRTNP